MTTTSKGVVESRGLVGEGNVRYSICAGAYTHISVLVPIMFILVLVLILALIQVLMLIFSHAKTFSRSPVVV